MQAERGLTARLRSVDLGDSTARNATHANRRIEIDRARRDGLDPYLLIRTEPHDRALPAVLLDLGDGQIQRLLLVVLQSRHSHFSLILSVSRGPLWPCSVIVPEKRSIRYPNKIRSPGLGFKPNVKAKRRWRRAEPARDRPRRARRPRRIGSIRPGVHAGRSRLKRSVLTASAYSS